MKDMSRIEQRNDDVHIEEGTHGLNALLIHNLEDMFQRDYLIPLRQYRYAVTKSL